MMDVYILSLMESHPIAMDIIAVIRVEKQVDGKKEFEETGGEHDVACVWS